MEQRPLRLGDSVDDYCPRERRITNHVIVAIVDDAIKQTRCATCDAEHTYKAARTPARRRKDGRAELYGEVLASVGGSQLVAPRSDDDAADEAHQAEAADSPPRVEAAEPTPPEISAADTNGAGDNRPEEAWSPHRPLIRATLPRTENETPTPRPIPEFTMYQRHSRGFRHGGQGWSGGNGGGGGRGGGFRPGRSGQGQGQGQGQGAGHGRNHGRKHNKRSR